MEIFDTQISFPLMFHAAEQEVRNASDGGSTDIIGVIGIAVFAALLVVAIACIIGLVVWIVRLKKTNAKIKSVQL